MMKFLHLKIMYSQWLGGQRGMFLPQRSRFKSGERLNVCNVFLEIDLIQNFVKMKFSYLTNVHDQWLGVQR